MTKRPFTVTSGGNAYAWVVYGFQVVIGLSIMFGQTRNRSGVYDLLRDAIEAIGTGMMFGGALGLVTLIVMEGWKNHTKAALRLEILAASLVGFINIILALAMGVAGASAMPIGYAACFGIGGLYRVVQILIDLHRHKKAMERQALSDPMLAEPHKHT